MNQDPNTSPQNPSPENTLPVPSASTKPDNSWAGKKLTLGWLIGLIVMAVFSVACSLLSARISGANGAYASGIVMGGIFWPLLITALFAISAYFRKAPRRLAVVAMIAFGVFGFSNLSSALQRRIADGASTDTALNELKDMRRQLAQTDDLNKRAAISQRAEALIKNAADKMTSEQAANEMSALAKFVAPLFEQRRAFDAAAQEFFGNDNDWARYIDTQETLALGRERLARVRQRSKAVYQTMDSLVAKAATMIRNNDTSLGISVAAFKGFHSSYVAKAQKFKDVDESQTKMFARIDDVLAMLQTEWGKWSKDTDGVIQWESNELLKKFLVINNDIDTLSVQLGEREKALLQ